MPSKAGTIFSTAWLREKPAPLPTERVAIAKAIEEEIKAQGERRGGDRKSELAKNQSGQLTGLIDSGETRAIAAEKAGFGTVVAVVENHTPKSGMTFAVGLNGVR